MARPQSDPAEEGLGGRANQQIERKKWLAFGDFETMDTEPARIALNPKRPAWAENLIIIANNDLRAVPGPGSTLATLTGETITARYYAFFNNTDYLVLFCNSGAAYTVDVATGIKVNFAPAGTFTATPEIAQWEDQRILIADTIAGYCNYDGNLLIVEGNVSSDLKLDGGGMGYVSAPTVAITGGTGSGAAVTATVVDGEVTTLTMTNAGTGYALGDFLKVTFTGGTPTPGGVSSITLLNVGHDYRTAPTIAITAPSGGGVTATATATVSFGQITAITVQNLGTTYAETPDITITPAGADINAGGAVAVPVMETVASATVTVWPFFDDATKPSTIAIYQGRVFLGRKRTINYTGTAGYDDVDPANAAGFVVLSDSDVVHTITKLYSANNFLFILCDNSIKQIGQISVDTNNLTQFTINSLSSDQGTIYPASVASYDRAVVFTNQIGVYAVFGASVQKISAPMTGVIDATDFSLYPVADVFDFDGKHVLLVLVRYTDPDAGARSLLMAHYDKRWSVLAQGDSITGIVTAHLLGRERLFATQGAVISELFSDSTVAVLFKLKTALAHDGAPMINKRAIRIGIGQSASEPNIINAQVESENGSSEFSFQAGRAVVWQNNSLQTITWQNNALDTIQWIIGGYVWYETAQIDESGIYLGATVSGSLKSYHFNNLIIEYVYGPTMKSSNLT